MPTAPFFRSLLSPACAALKDGATFKLGQYPAASSYALGKVYDRNMGKHVIHISEEEAAATSVATLLTHVRAGAEVIIENGMRPVAVLHLAEPVHRTISECIALLPEGSTATIDPDFARDVASAVEGHREPLNPPTWD